MIGLFDVQTGFGGGRAGERCAPSCQDLLAEMKRFRIERALVRTAPEDLDRDVPASNDVLYAACAENDGLLPCPDLIPSWGGDVPCEIDQVDQLVRRRGGAASLRPKLDAWSAEAWCSGPLFEALRERRVPAWCRESQFGLETIAELARRYPELPFIAASLNYRDQRVLLAMLETFPNVFLSIGNRYTVHLGIEQFVERVGPQRLLFGSGFPDADIMPAITMLMYAGISDEDKRLIGSGNMDRLVEEIRR